MSGYGRRAAAPGQQHIDTALFSQGSGDYNPLFFNQDLACKAQSSSILAAHQGPRPLDWTVVAAKSAGGAVPAAAGGLQWDQSSRNSSIRTSRTKDTSMSTTWSPGMLQQQVPTASAAAGYDAGRYQPQAAAGLGTIPGTPGLGDNSVAAAAAAYRRRPAASTAADAGAGAAPGRSSVVHGPEIAGYKSVVTKNPVSPSGYSVGMQPAATAPAAALPARHSTGISAGAQATAGYAMAGGSSSRTAAAAAAGVSNPVAAAAAAALTALGGRSKHSLASTPAAAGPALGAVSGSDLSASTAAVGLHTGSFNTCTVPEFSIADVAAAAGLHEHSTWVTAEPAAAAASGPAAMLKWNVQARPPAQTAVAGRRADASRSRGAAGSPSAADMDVQQYSFSRQTNSAGISSRHDTPEQQQQQLQQQGYISSSRYSGSSARQQTPPDAGYDAAGYGSSSSRPPSQQLTEGLSKLKQLSTARLATRLTTPPTSNVFGGGNQQQEGGAGCGNSSSSNRRMTSGGRCCSNAGTLHQQQHQQQQEWGDVTAGGGNGYTPSSYSSGVQRTTSRGQHSMAGASVLAQAAVNGSGKAAASRGGARSDAGFGAAAAAAAAAAQYEASAQLQGWGEDEYGAGAKLQQCGNCGRSFVAAALQRHTKVCAKVFCQKRKVFNMQSQRLKGLQAAKFAPKDEVDQGWGKPEYSSSSSKPGCAGRKPAGGSSSSNLQRQRQTPARAGPGSTSNNGRQQQQQQQSDSRPAMSAAAAKKSKWQQQSEQLRMAMRAGQGGSSGSGHGSGFGGSYPTEQPEEDNRIPCPHCGRRFAELAAERHIPKCSEIRAKPIGLKAGGGKQSYMRSNSRR